MIEQSIRGSDVYQDSGVDLWLDVSSNRFLICAKYLHRCLPNQRTGRRKRTVKPSLVISRSGTTASNGKITSLSFSSRSFKERSSISLCITKRKLSNERGDERSKLQNAREIGVLTSSPGFSRHWKWRRARESHANSGDPREPQEAENHDNERTRELQEPVNHKNQRIMEPKNYRDNDF